MFFHLGKINLIYIGGLSIMTCTKKAKTPKLFDVVVADTFSNKNDIIFPGNLIVSGNFSSLANEIVVLGDLIICGKAKVYVNNFEIGGNLYVLATEDGKPFVEVFSAKVHGSYYSNCGNSFYSHKLIALEGCETDFTSNSMPR